MTTARLCNLQEPRNYVNTEIITIRIHYIFKIQDIKNESKLQNEE